MELLWVPGVNLSPKSFKHLLHRKFHKTSAVTHLVGFKPDSDVWYSHCEGRCSFEGRLPGNILGVPRSAERSSGTKTIEFHVLAGDWRSSDLSRYRKMKPPDTGRNIQNTTQCHHRRLPAAVVGFPWNSQLPAVLGGAIGGGAVNSVIRRLCLADTIG